MKVRLLSVMVDDQDKALKFYTEKLGFVKKVEIPLGKYKWLTVTAADEPDGLEVVLEPLGFPPSAAYQKTLFDAGIPAVAFMVDNVEDEYKRLTDAGVSFSMQPTKMGAAKLAILDDTCGNRIQIFQIL